MPNNRSGKMAQAGGSGVKGSLSNNIETDTHTDDLALANSLLLIPKTEYVATEEDVKDAIVYENGATSLDFMLPEDEREILEKNLNNYGDMEKMQKALNMAKKNKLLQEDVKALNQLSKLDDLIENVFDIMNDPESLEAVRQDIKKKLETGEVTKAYKEIGLTNKAMIDAREGLINRMKSKATGKNAKIAFKFTNGNGEETQIGVNLDGE